MPTRVRLADPDLVAAALERRSVDQAEPGDTRLLVKHLLAVLATRHPGHALEVRVPPYAAVQCLAGTRHTRGTPPAVVETDAGTWLALALGELGWAEASGAGRVRASGERSDLSDALPLVTPG